MQRICSSIYRDNMARRAFLRFLQSTSLSSSKLCAQRNLSSASCVQSVATLKQQRRLPGGNAVQVHRALLSQPTTADVIRSHLAERHSSSSASPPSNTSEFFFHEKLCSIVGRKNVSTTTQVRTQHSKDESHFSAVLTDYVTFPNTTEQVSAICKLCYENNVPITPFGTGTGLEGGVNALKGGVSIALNNMDQVVEVNVEDFDCTVQAGVTWRDLNHHLSDTGLFFPVDPGASASLGGMASTGASGTNAVRYGTMKENVLNLQVVLPNGDITKTHGTLSRARKSAAGLNLTELFVGNEGILGIITQVTLRLYPLPENTCICVCHFPDNKSSIDTVIELLQNNVPLSRIEYLDDHSVNAANNYSKTDLPVMPSLFMEIIGNQASIDETMQLVEGVVEENGGTGFQHSSKMEERSRLWKARHELYYACRNTRPGQEAIITDVCVPISKLTEIILKMRQYLTEYNLNGFSFGHVGDGNFHSVITYDEANAEEVDNVYKVTELIGKDAIGLGGTCTGEHGIGRGKKHLLEFEHDPVSLDLMRKIKSVVDPKNLLNPGKVI